MGGIGIAVYIVGIAVEIPSCRPSCTPARAASAMNGTDLSWIVGLVVTVPLYYLLAARRRTQYLAAKMARVLLGQVPGEDEGDAAARDILIGRPPRDTAPALA